MAYKVLFDQSGQHITVEGNLDEVPLTSSISEIIRQIKKGQETLSALAIDDIIGLCDAVANSWTHADHALVPLIREQGLGFIPLWMRKLNLQSICDISFKGNRQVLDGFVSLSDSDTRLFRCQPRGLIVHWIAGNVPVLGMISLIQSMLGKNATLIKASRNDPGLLPTLLNSFKQVSYTTHSGVKISGEILSNSIAVIYSDKNDNDAARFLSSSADVRVAWGGREAVESIMNLPRRFGTEDIVFGPKISFIVVGIEYLTNEETAKKLARNIIRDVSAFDQQGCNSPHTVFIETGGEIEPQHFAKIVAKQMELTLTSRPLKTVQPGDSMNVLGVRAEYDMRGDAYYSQGMGWTAVYSAEDSGLAPPCYQRTLFFRPINDVFDIASLCSINTQTAGLAVNNRHTELANALTKKGVERCPLVGGMSLYTTPWDGMFPIDRMVRWVSTSVETER